MAGISRRPPRVPPTQTLSHAAERAGRSCDVDHADLVHVTSAGWGERVLLSGLLEARACKVFNKDLLYFFLARPVYRLSHFDDKSDQLCRFPFIFVVDPGPMGSPYHVYPFDTGAAHQGFFDGRADRTRFLEDYALNNSIDAAKRHIAWAFGSFESYLQGEVRPDLAQETPKFEFCAQSWIEISRLGARTNAAADEADSRAVAIEIAYKNSIQLSSGYIRTIILPDKMLESDGVSNTPVMEALRRYHLAWKVYEWLPNDTPDNMMRKVERILRSVS